MVIKTLFYCLYQIVRGTIFKDVITDCAKEAPFFDPGYGAKIS